MMEIGLLCAIVLLPILIGIVIYNSIINNENAVKRAWANVIAEERKKNKITPSLEKLVQDYQGFEKKVQLDITALRTAVSRLQEDKVDSESLAEAERETGKLIQGLKVAVENYPELKAAETYQSLMREISEQQEHIAAAIRIFNQNVEAFNNGIEVFPNSLINGLFNKKDTMATFKDTEAESGFEFTPKID